MNPKYYLSKIFLITLFIYFSNTTNAQTIPQKNGYFYVGMGINIATLSTGTSVKTLMNVIGGYNTKVSNHLFAGPQVTAVFIKSPANKGARISLFVGPSTEMEIKRIGKNPPLSSQSISNRLSWVFPINPKSSDYTYMDCISLSTSLSNDEFFGFNKSSIDFNIDFQGYDIGFYNGLSRMISVSTGTRTTF